MSYSTSLKSAFTGLALALSGLGVMPADADPVPPRPIDPDSPAFRADNPIKVYVTVDTDTRRGEDYRFDRTALDEMARRLPPYVRLVDRPERSDLTIVADQVDYDLDFRVVDRDRRSEPYRRYTAGRCGGFERAYYTYVRETGNAVARYSLDVRMRHFGRDIDHIRLDTRGGYDYVTDLRARTNCGLIDTRHAPNTQVRDLLIRDSRATRADVSRGIREAAARDLGRALAAKVMRLSDQYYDGLSYALMSRVAFRGGAYWAFRGRDGWVRTWQRGDRDDWYDRWDGRQHRRPH